MIFLLTKIHEVDYDEIAGFVIRAKDAKEARILADKEDNDSFNFLNPLETSCEVINPEGESEIILRDFRAG
jgi:hypothetical protein